MIGQQDAKSGNHEQGAVWYASFLQDEKSQKKLLSCDGHRQPFRGASKCLTIKTVGKLSERQPATPSFETDGEKRESKTQTKGGQSQTTFEKRGIKSPALEIGYRKPGSMTVRSTK